MDAFDEILTERLLLRRLRSNEEGSQDLEWLHAVASDESARQFSPRAPCRTKLESRLFMADLLPPPNHTTRIVYAVFTTSSPTPSDTSSSPSPKSHHHTLLLRDGEAWEIAGIVSLTSLHPSLPSLPATPTHEDINVGYFFLPVAWGRGFATESLREVLRVYGEVRSTEESAKVDLCATVWEGNRKSIRVVQKLGMEATGKVFRRVSGGMLENMLEFRKRLI